MNISYKRFLVTWFNRPKNVFRFIRNGASSNSGWALLTFAVTRSYLNTVVSFIYRKHVCWLLQSDIWYALPSNVTSICSECSKGITFKHINRIRSAKWTELNKLIISWSALSASPSNGILLSIIELYAVKKNASLRVVGIVKVKHSKIYSERI